VVNNQANKAGLQTIQAADITLTSAVIAAANVNQGTTYQVVYAAKMKVATYAGYGKQYKSYDLVAIMTTAILLTPIYIIMQRRQVISGASYLGYAPLLPMRSA
jgi:hypothetical protein